MFRFVPPDATEPGLDHGILSAGSMLSGFFLRRHAYLATAGLSCDSNNFVLGVSVEEAWGADIYVA